jgi:heterotetrameric sarcosine oxidase delta subunit
MRIRCPFCGDRSHAEFAYRGDAGPVRPSAPDPMLFHDYVYLRDNPAGLHREHWQHVGGCRAWLVVTRDVTTHAIQAVAVAGGRTAAGREMAR